MIVTDSKEYNVLLGNAWLKHVNAMINYKNNQMTIEYDELRQTIPITCMQKLDPTQFIIIDPKEELELEDEDYEETAHFNTAKIIDNHFEIDKRKYSHRYMEYCSIKNKGGSTSIGLGKCYCEKKLITDEQCLTCSEIEEDWTIYNAMTEPDKPLELHLQLI